MDQPHRSRLVGVDVARGLAVLGMFTAHLGHRRAAVLPNGSSWLEAADGRSAAAFALLAGVSAALLSGGDVPYAGLRLRHARVRVLARAALLWPLGLAMIALGTPVVVILPTYALLFAATAGLLHLGPRTLLALAAVVILVAPPLVLLARDAAYATEQPPGELVDLTIGPFYPAVIWIAYLLVGLAVGRADLRAPTTRRRLLVWGSVAAVAGLATNAVAMRALDSAHTFRRALLTTRPHSSSGVELVANIGVVLVVLALCLMIAERFPRAVAAVAATGALALTAYCGQLVAIAALGGAQVVLVDPSNVRLAVFVVVTLVVTWAWRVTWGRGPLELALHVASSAVADRAVPGALESTDQPATVPPGP